MIAVVDSGGANLTSVINALENLGHKPVLTADPDQISRSAKVFLPGVGAAACAMESLRRTELDSCIRSLKQPVLGICLGMQILFESSEEGPTDCLGILPGKVTLLTPKDSSGAALTVPHMGWNQVLASSSSPSVLFRGIREGEYFYFVHSYRAPESAFVKAFCDYGDKIPAVVERENFFGVQFHPERSSKAGAMLLANFLSL